MSTLSAKSLRQVGPHLLGIVWNDNHNSIFNVRNLRLACPCAGCVDEVTRKKTLKESDVSKDIKPQLIESVGRYAIGIRWSDGHSTGIYTFDYLRGLCECPACKH